MIISVDGTALAFLLKGRYENGLSYPFLAVDPYLTDGLHSEEISLFCILIIHLASPLLSSPSKYSIAT